MHLLTPLNSHLQKQENKIKNIKIYGKIELDFLPEVNPNFTKLVNLGEMMWHCGAATPIPVTIWLQKQRSPV